MAKIVTLWLVLTPFIVWNGTFEGPKVFLFLTAGFLLSIYWITRSFKKRSRLKLETVDMWYLGWLLVLIISSLSGLHPKDSILGASYRHQGVIFFLTLWLVGKTFEQFENKEKNFLYKGIGMAVILESLIVLYQYVSGTLYFGKPLGTLGETNAVGGFLAIGSYFVFVSYPKLYLLVPALSILLTQSRSAMISFIANIWLIFKLSSKKNIIPLLIFGSLAAGIIAYFSLGKGTSVFENRPVIWQLAVQQFIQKPILGYGAESSEVVFDKAFSQFKFPLAGIGVDRAHNLFLDIGIWSGGLGVFLFCGYLYKRFVSLGDSFKKIAFLAFLIYAFLQPLSVVHWILFILI